LSDEDEPLITIQPLPVATQIVEQTGRGTAAFLKTLNQWVAALRQLSEKIASGEIPVPLPDPETWDPADIEEIARRFDEAVGIIINADAAKTLIERYSSVSYRVEKAARDALRQELDEISGAAVKVATTQNQLKVEFRNGQTKTRASVLQEAGVRASADDALAFLITQLEAEFENETSDIYAAITTEQNARVDADNALAADITTLEAAIDTLDTDLSAEIANVQSAYIAADQAIVLDYTGRFVTVSDDIDTVSAAVSDEATARANADSALASDISEVAASFNDVSASGMVSFKATASPAGVTATYQVTLRAVASGITYGGGFLLDLISDGAGGYYVEEYHIVDRFIVGNEARDVAANVFEIVGGQVRIDNAYIRELNADNISVKSLDADEVLIDGTVITEIIAQNAVSNTAAMFGATRVGLTSTDSIDITLQTVDISVPVTGPISLMGSFVTFTANIPSNTYLLIEILRGTTVIHESLQKIDQNWEYAHGFNVAYIDTPPTPGTITYSLRASTANSSGTKIQLIINQGVGCAERYLQSQLLKR
jgi:hypothetical protein